jgi:hypothetical protein
VSLISEALRKAHTEAMRQDSAGARVFHTPGSVDFPREPQSRRPLIMAIAVSNLLLVVVVSLVVYHVISRGTASGAAETPVLTAAVEPPVFAQSQAAVAQPESTPVPAASPVEETPTPAPRPVTSPAPAAAVVAEERSPTESRVAPQKIEHDEPAPTPPTRHRTGLVNGQTYMHSIPTVGGSDIVLNGVSVVGDRGVALINGRMVREGERVGGFTVGKISGRQVELRTDGLQVYLRLP